MKNISFLALTFFLLFSCTSSDEKKLSGIIELADGWVRPGKAGMMSAAYFNLKNGTAYTDTLLSISSDVTSNTQIHESYQTEEGLMGMREQEFVILPSNKTTAFKQGGLHVMIIQPNQDIAEGDSVTFTLKFSTSKELKVKLPVKISSN